VTYACGTRCGYCNTELDHILFVYLCLSTVSVLCDVSYLVNNTCLLCFSVM